MDTTAIQLRQLQRERYDRLWTGAIDRISAGAIEIDPVLAERRLDLRRGITVVIRPLEPVRTRVIAFLDSLRKVEPDQHYYSGNEFHVTFLSLFTATVEHEKFFAKAEEYEAAVTASLAKVAPFAISFSGITASSGAIMIQGFTDDEALNEARDVLRRELRVRGLAGSLDDRYRLETAHMTVARFRSPLRDGRQFAETLKQYRSLDFGQTRVESLELVANDWYVSHGTLKQIRTYRLAETE